MEVCNNVITVPLTGVRRSELRRAMYVAQGGRCWYCNGMMRLYPTMTSYGTLPPDYPTFEHITPVRRKDGKRIGPETPTHRTALNNQVLVCSACNQRRGVRPLTSFIGELRESGFTRGIVARIRHLVNDHRPAPWRADLFELYMLQALAHPRRPADTLKRLPGSLESAVLPDPAPPRAMLAVDPPAPRRRPPPLILRLSYALHRCIKGLRRALRRKEAACR